MEKNIRKENEYVCKTESAEINTIQLQLKRKKKTWSQETWNYPDFAVSLLWDHELKWKGHSLGLGQ